ncbi:MAG: hypothetical protein AB1324_00050 [Candidatus Micrarchaeota archaeon]
MKFLAIAVFLAALPAAFAVQECEDSYDSCITYCCEDCGSLTYDSNGDLMCDLGPASEADQYCIDSCESCSESYQACLQAYDDYGYDSGGTTQCCGSAAVLGGVLGLAFLRK